jgi:Soluble lytic murein transglycosylase and related regulatory proteins (some contain LysM/invasin domains)
VAISPKPNRRRLKPQALTRKKSDNPRPTGLVKTPKPRKKAVRKPRTQRAFWNRKNLLSIALECAGLAVTGLLGTMLALGSAAHTFSGSGFFASLLPFAAGIAGWVIFNACVLLLWIKIRRWLKERSTLLPAILAICSASGLGWFVLHDGYTPVFTHFRSLVGGKQQAARTTLAHQVYAEYRRHNQAQLQNMLQRADVFAADIELAANTFSVDENLLFGIAAAESSFRPRNSQDGGQGLFQITAVPKAIWQQSSQALETQTADPSIPRHNAFIAAATFRHYLAEMKNDLFLGLLAYNIGPRNGGLRFIMQQYGATDFVTLQPYLQKLPRDYPIRVLSYALAFKIRQQYGKLLPYQEGDNASKIQRMGIPGLSNDY